MRLVNFHVNWRLLKALISFWNKENAVFVINHVEVTTPTLEEYRELLGAHDWSRGIAEPNIITVDTISFS